MSTQSEDGREVEPSTAGRDDQGNHSSSSEQVELSLDPYSVIRLIQCPRCSQPLRVPLRLPCGNTLCRSCLPPLIKREGVSHPLEAGREEGFTCPWKGKGCGNINDGGLLTEHSMSDCGVDVVVSKVLDAFEKVLGDSAGHDVPLLQIRWTPAIENEKETDNADAPKIGKAVIQHGRYLGTYKLMKEGGLRYNIKDVVYEDVEPSGGLSESIKHDEAVLKQLKEAVRNELDCQVCYGLFMDPLTSSCGHTFCQKCLVRMLDHSILCPVCRKRLSFRPGQLSEPVNGILSGVIDSLYPDEIDARREAAKNDDVHGDTELLPLFVCTPSFPSMPTFLHIFEPRYRLMIRRALNTGRRFGMVAFNRIGQPQGELGVTEFMEYGTVLRIDRINFLSDGRSLMTAIGLTRFKVVDWGVLDGYHIARTERIDDISLAEEESLEAREMAAAASNATPSEGNDGESSEMPLETLSTQQLLQLCLDFVQKCRAEGAPWLRQHTLASYGEPPADPARFPYWFASVLPIEEEEKYALLPTTSMRERLKITARWARKLESKEWTTTSSPCSVL